MIVSLFKKLLPAAQPWRTVVIFVLCAVAVAAVLALFSQVQSCGYDRARAEYQAERDAWKEERGKLLGAAEAKEQQAAGLQVQVQAYKAAQEAGKRVDDQLAAKIEQVAEEARNEESRAEVPVDCRVRAERVCALFRSGDARFDCRAIFAECDRSR